MTPSYEPAKKPRSDEGKRLEEQEKDAVDNASEGYGHVPASGMPMAPDTTRKPALGGTEPTHAPDTASHRR